MKRLAVVGAGFSGAVIAHQLAQAGYELDVFETRPHIAGNCFTKQDPVTGILIHVYGPHIFHTSNELVWEFIRKFDDFVPFTNRVKAIATGRVFSLPINLLTINQFFNKKFSPEEAETFISSLGDKSIQEPSTFEEQALKFLGRELYEAFFKSYTIKQWGVQPSELPASILKRLPVRFNYDDNYYASRYQALPRRGYTHVVERLLDLPNIRVHLSTKFQRARSRDYQHVFYSGPIDGWFDCSLGRLGYRTLDFVSERHRGDYQGNAVINYCDSDVAWTRIAEHKHFSPWDTHTETVIFKEFSRSCEQEDEPYYPLRLLKEKTLLAQYLELAKREPRTTFVGRLGTYRYIDMHVAVAEALEAAEKFLDAQRVNETLPPFLVNPLG